MKIKINGEWWSHFADFKLFSNLDAVASTWAFKTLFDPSNPSHKKLLKPLQYYKVEFYHDDGTIFSTGTFLNHDLISASEPELALIEGYSLGGVLEDCQVPYKSYPLESDDRTLKEIAERLFKYFGLNLIIYPTAEKACNESIEKSVADPQETVKDYISKIAAQKNVIFSHDIHGNLIMFQPDPKAKSKAFYTKDNVIRMRLSVRGQGLHSQLTTLRQPSRDDSDGTNDGTQLTAAQTITNPLVAKYRPFVSVLTSGTDTDTASGVENAYAAELMNIRVIVVFEKWQIGISIGDFVDIQNDEIYFYKRTRMMVQNITMEADSSHETMEMTLVLPEAFSADTPKFRFE